MPFFKRKQDKQKATSPAGKETATLKRTPSTRSNPQTPDSLNGDIGIPDHVLNPHKLILESLGTLENDPDQTGTSPKSPVKTSSCLSKSLQEILHDKDALHCFIQFMESQQAERFIRFWLDANSFQASTLTRMRTHSLQSVGSSALMKRRTETKSGDGDERVNSQNLSGERTNDSVAGVCVTEEGRGECIQTEEEGGSNTDCDRPNVPGGGCVDAGAKVESSCINSADKSNTTKEAGAEKVSKPSSLPLASTPVQVRVTLAPSEDLSNISADLGKQHSPYGTDRSQSSLQDSGIATPSDGEFVITPEIPSDNDSVDTLIDDDGKATAGGKKRDRNIDKSTAAEGALMEGSGKNQAGTVIGETDTPDRETKDGMAGKLSRLISVEEMREKLKKSIERDAVSIFTKYIAQDAPQPIGVGDVLRGETIHKICGEDKQVDPECFVACQDFVVMHMEKEYHKPFTDSEFHCKHQVHVLTGSQIYLPDVLYNEHALCYFMEFMEQEGGQHLMQLWMAADNFQQQLIQQEGGYDGMQAQSDAMIVYDRFFSLQATTPLGFDDKIRFEVEGNICQESGPLPDCFSKPRDIVLHTLEKVYFPRYLSSEIYYRYLSDLINTVQMAQDLPVKRHRRQASDASSEHSVGSQSTGTDSISSRNTLLAAGSRGARKATTPSTSSLSGVVGKIEEHLGTMDSDLLNPEDLWKQPSKSSLRLGSVNSLGQFVSEFDPDPDGSKKKSGVFFKKNKSKEKEQEEMAAQVAQMILNDVATMTQMGDACAGPDNHNSNSSKNNSGSAGLGTPSSSLSLASAFSSTSSFEPPPS